MHFSRPEYGAPDESSIASFRYIYDAFVVVSECSQGQTESKKRSRSVETKGTQMSFGFKKKLPLQKRNALSAGATKANETATCDGASANSLSHSAQTCCIGDSNGNSGTTQN